MAIEEFGKTQIEVEAFPFSSPYRADNGEAEKNIIDYLNNQ